MASCAGARTILELSKRRCRPSGRSTCKNAISFGSQIHLHAAALRPVGRKDHRNNCEIGDTDAVLMDVTDKLLRDTRCGSIQTGSNSSSKATAPGGLRKLLCVRYPQNDVKILAREIDAL